MLQFRRLVCILLGFWLGAGVAVDVAVTQNFATVDRFIRSPDSVAVVLELNKIGRPAARELLRRNAAEENNFLFENWEWTELALGTLLFLVMLFGERPQKIMLFGVALMLLLVIVQRFALTPRIVELGRLIPGMPTEAPQVKTFWTYHGLYSGGELLKLGTGFLLSLRLILRRKKDRELFKKEYEANLRAPSVTGKTVTGKTS